MKPTLTIDLLIKSAKEFCKTQSSIFRKDLYKTNDGKAVGTLVEHLFKNFLQSKFELEIGNSASGLDLPSINTDIKVTSIKQPQSSCPYKDSKQKIYGLGYNLIVFVYEKESNDTNKTARLNFLSCTFIDAKRTGDYQTTTGILNLIKNSGNVDDIFAFLSDHKIPADDVTLYNLSQKILSQPPLVGYLTISNALQWRLQYGRIVYLEERVDGIIPIVEYTSDD